MSDEYSKHDHVLMALVMNLQAMGLVQLGKVTHPATGEIARDLEDARGTIDLLDMLRTKCRAGTPADLLKLMDRAVLDLQMNYLDELKKDQRTAAAAPGAAPSGEPAGGPAGEATGDATGDAPA